MKGISATTIAATFALAAFTVAVLAGLGAANAASSVLVRAIIAMIVCYPVGLAAGTIAQRLIGEHIEEHQQANPAPDSSDEAVARTADNENDDDDEDVMQAASVVDSEVGDEEVIVV